MEQNDAKARVLQFLSDDENVLYINKELISNYGLEQALFIADLIQTGVNHGNGWYTKSLRDMMADLKLTREKIRTVKKKLLRSGAIEKCERGKGQDGKYYYKIPHLIESMQVPDV